MNIAENKKVQYHLLDLFNLLSPPHNVLSAQRQLSEGLADTDIQVVLATAQP